MEASAIFNLDEALARVDQDMELFLTLADLFQQHAPHDLADTKAALASGNPVGLARAAHRLKGAILQFSAPTLYESISELEALGKAGTLETGALVCARVETGLHQLLEALSRVRATAQGI
jgi:HPt (histidine-containing phosphotransfer) domain-containing protein